MHPISRRAFFAGSVAVLVGACSDSAGTAPSGASDDPPASTAPASTAPASTAPASTAPVPSFATDPFTLGVASGDPDATSVVLWTRLAPDPLAGGGVGDDTVTVTWEASRDPGFATIDRTGTTEATAAFGHSVHLVAELDPGEWWYRFRVGEHTSAAGLTRTAPGRDDEVASARFVSASCQNYEDGHYVAHRDIAAQRPDFLVWLGDYIYEGSPGQIGVDGNVRSHGTTEVVSIEDYRNRYALYRSDPDLQAAHAACPWFAVWDDHEVENNYAALAPQNAAEAATFADRRRSAYQVWWEHMPVRLAPPSATADELRIYRDCTWGDLLHVALLDTRQYRSDQACGDPTLSLEPACPETTTPGRTLTGADQEDWLFDTLAEHRDSTVWNVIGQQVVFGDLTLDAAVLNYDQWDGYPEQRARLLQRFADDQVANLVVLSGDIHLAGTGTIRVGERGVGRPVGVEFVATSISSGGLVDPAVTDLVKGFPDILDAELEHRGYILHTVTAELWSAEYRMVESVKVADSTVYVHNTYAIDAGTSTVRFAN